MATPKKYTKAITQVPLALTYEPKILPPLQLLPQTSKTPIPINQTTAHKLASLLQEVASIMDTITGEKMMCGEELDGLEGDVLGGLTEMVLIMEEEVEEMVQLADAVEEYVEELELAELDEWVAALATSKDSDGTNVGEGCWTSQGNEAKGWGMEQESIALGDGKESIRIGLDDKVIRHISLGGLLEELEEDVLGWKVRGLSVNSDNYGSGEPSEVVIEAGVSVPITNYRKDEVVRKTVISLSPRKKDMETKFRDSGLGLMSPAGLMRSPIKKEPKVVMKSSPIGLRTGLGSIRRKKTVKKPQWV
ncbi:hypothetical protein SBOR_8915 [Sclerotinia borealis F-4128]|uniref:Uncharacterized protein n=1 Tax=Sclerotinia borealis (strain F-4128) TaxID=1432307 RepID=W9C717_SCLBF|nr:hypothetical protein SBOR_8915 [Sclerotinia borealis F-4128]